MKNRHTTPSFIQGTNCWETYDGIVSKAAGHTIKHVLIVWSPPTETIRGTLPLSEFLTFREPITSQPF